MRARHLVALAVLTPSLVLAQRGGRPPEPGRARADDADPSGPRGGGPMKAPSGSDLEKQSPVRYVLDKRKKLALTDSQVTQLQALAEKLKAQDAPIYQRADSLRKAGDPPRGSFAELTDDERTKLVAYRLALGDILDSARTHQRSAAEQAFAVLTEEQRTKAQAMMQEEREAQRRAHGMDAEQNLGKGYTRGPRRP